MYEVKQKGPITELYFFMHGTAYHEGGNVNSHVSTFAQAMKAKNPGQNNVIIMNGPGGTPEEEAEDSTIAGMYVLDTKSSRRIPINTKIPKALFQAVSVATGYGVEHNLMEMLLLVSRMIPPPKTIYLDGFSRGADACERFANIMYAYAPHIEINIMARDPVAGPGRGAMPLARRIPPNVKNYTATLAMNMKSGIYDPQDLSELNVIDPNKTKVTILPIPGQHGTHARVVEYKTFNEDASKLVADCAWDYYQRWGIDVAEVPHYTIDPNKQGATKLVSRDGGKLETNPKKILDRYARMRNNYDENNKRNPGTRFLNFHLADYCPILPEYFFNQHHLFLFAKEYPETFKWLLTKKRDEYFPNKIVQDELDSMSNDLRTSIQKFKYTNLKPVYFNPDEDRLDGNYLKIVMAIHRYLKLRKYHQKEDHSALIKAREIITSDLSPAEKEKNLLKLVHKLMADEKTPSLLKKILCKRFPIEPPSLQNELTHMIQAERNMIPLLRADPKTKEDRELVKFESSLNKMQKMVDEIHTNEELQTNFMAYKEKVKKENIRDKPDSFQKQFLQPRIINLLSRILEKINDALLYVRGYQKTL